MKMRPTNFEVTTAGDYRVFKDNLAMTNPAVSKLECGCITLNKGDIEKPTGEPLVRKLKT